MWLTNQIHTVVLHTATLEWIRAVSVLFVIYLCCCPHPGQQTHDLVWSWVVRSVRMHLDWTPRALKLPAPTLQSDNWRSGVHRREWWRPTTHKNTQFIYPESPIHERAWCGRSDSPVLSQQCWYYSGTSDTSYRRLSLVSATAPYHPKTGRECD